MKKFSLLFAFLLTLVGGTRVWAETLTATFDSGLPEGWSIVGDLSNADDRARSGKGIWTSSKSTTGNYLITEVVEGTFEFYARAYNKSYASTVVIYEYTGSGLGNQLYTTGSMYTSSTPTWSKHTTTISNATQLAIVLDYAAIDDVTYTKGSTSVNAPSMKVSATSYDFGLTTAGTAATFKITNNGNTDYTISVSATNGYGASLSTTTLNIGDEATLTVTMASATADGVVTISSSDTNIAKATINVSGMIRDASKLFADFSEKTLPAGWYTSGGSWTYTNEYASGQSYSAYKLVTPRITVKTGDRLYFKYRKNYNTTLTSYNLQVQYTTDDDRTNASWTNVGSTLNTNYNEWNAITVDIPATATYVAFSATRFDIDDIYGLSLYEGPTNLAVTKTSTSATMTWTAANMETAWQVYVSTDLNAINTATPTNVSGTASYTFENLQPITTYYAWVRSDFGNGSYSDWAVITFTTLRAPITTFPWLENFNSLTSGIPDGWDNSEGTVTTASYKWNYYTTGHDGAGLRFNSYNASNNQTNYLKTPIIAFAQNSAMQLKFWYKNPTGGDFSVYISNDGGATYTQSLATGLTSANDWTEKVIDLPTDTYYENVVIVFKGTSNYGSGDAYIYLDDVEVSENSAYAMSVSGNDVLNSAIAFGTVKNTTTTKTFTISNDGVETLTGISVVSSDNEAFTVSETGFSLTSGATKDITVTYVKGEVGTHNANITISQANVDNIVIAVSGTYETPTPATMTVTLDNSDVNGQTVLFGSVNKAVTKTFVVSNTGDLTLNATIESNNTTDFTVAPATLEVAGGETAEFTVTFVKNDVYDEEKTANITLKANGLENVSFATTGTRTETWSEDFEGGVIPDGWDNNGFTVKQNSVGSYPQYNLVSYFAVATGSSTNRTLVTPLLTATAGDQFTFDGFFYYGDEVLKVDYSTDRNEWTNIYTYDKTLAYENGSVHEITIEAPITGDFYLRFTANYYNGIDNLNGFKLAAAKEHDSQITEENIPAAGTQYADYTATVKVKEMAGKEEKVAAELWVGEEKVAEVAETTIAANSEETITLTFTPDKAMSGEAYIKVYNSDINLETTKTAVTIAAALVLDETVAPTLTEGVQPAVLVKYTATNGWGTICMPFALTSDIMNDIFGTGWKAYELKGYSNGDLKFSSTTTFYAGYPYIIFAENAVAHTEGIVLKNVNISKTTAQNDSYGNGAAVFQGTYAPMDAGSLEGKYGVTDQAKIAKGTANATMKGFRGYLELTNGANARLLFDGEEVTTSIYQMEDGRWMMEDGIYNLNGQKVQKAQKGLYIINGKKVVLK